MTLSQKLNKELNSEFTDAQAYEAILKTYLYGSKKKQREAKMQKRAKKMIASL